MAEHAEGVSMRHRNHDPNTPISSTRALLFDDAYDAGELLGAKLSTLEHIARLDHQSTVIVGVSEGGLPLAYMVSAALPMRVEVAPVAPVRAPYQRDIRVGMLVDDGTLYLEERLGLRHGAHGTTLDHLADRADEGLLEMMRSIGDQPGAAVEDCDVILVDDVIDTGMTAVACADWLRRWGARDIHLAAAVATERGLERARDAVDTVTVLAMLDDDQPPAQVFARASSPSMREVIALAGAMDLLNMDRASHQDTH